MANASKLCQLWQRVLFEGMTLKVSCQEKVESIVDQLITSYLDFNLQMQLNPTVLFDGEDEEENFGKDQRTTRNDDLDFFAKLIRQKVDFGLRLICERFTQLIGSYEASIQQNQLKQASRLSKQITYLVNVTNSLFSYGLPASTSKWATLRPKTQIDGEMMDKQGEEQAPQFIDFKIIQYLCYLCNITNQYKAQNIEVSTDLESALLSFTLAYKNHVLTD